MSSTWDPGYKSSGTTLSSGNLTATFSSTASGVACQRKMSGKTYFEVKVGSTLSTSQCVGVVNPVFSMGAGKNLGTDTSNPNSCGFYSTGAVMTNNATVTTIQTFAATNIVQIAVDPVNGLIWFNVNNGNWNNSGSVNPATGTGGISLSTMTLGSLLPAVSANNASDTATAAFASGGFTYSAPSGFDPIDTAQYDAVNDDVASRAATFTQYGATRKATVSAFSGVSMLPASRSTVFADAWFGGNLRSSIGGTQIWSPAAAATHISGQVTENGTPVSGKTVMLFDNSGKLLGIAKSNGSGNYSLPALGRGSQACWAIAFDPTSYQTIAFDRLTAG